jgi:hypothetical protein
VELEPGTTVGDWTVVRFIDEGGNGEIYEVDMEGEAGALKLLKGHKPESVRYRRFAREIEILQQLGPRPGVLPVTDAYLPDEPTRKDRPWFVMPLAAGLEEALVGAPVNDVVAAVAQIARVLASLHEEGIGHRDIKPANLYVVDGQPTVGDFGLVHVPDKTSIDEPGRIPGSLGYMADEIMADPDNAESAAADVFALAKVLYKLLVPRVHHPPQGSLRADGGPGSLARELTHPHAGSLDGLLEASTRHVTARISMPALAEGLEAWLRLPEPATLGDEMDAALAAARAAMNDTVSRRDVEAVRVAEVRRLVAVLNEAAAPLVDAVTAIDPTGAKVGEHAIGNLSAYVEQPMEAGSLWAPGNHHGVRIERDVLGDRMILLLDFCLQVEVDADRIVVSALLLEGDEHTMNSTSQSVGPLFSPVGVPAEEAVAVVVNDAASYLPRFMAAFAERTT